MSDIIVNGKAYDSVDVKTQINGVPINVKSLTYGNEQEHQLNHTMSVDATSWSHGKNTPSASMTVMMADILPLEVAAGGNIRKIKPFIITTEYVNDYNMIVVDRIVAKFKSDGRDVTGDMGLEKQYELFALKVDLNVGAQTVARIIN
ncbi:hypothetical protein OZ664_19870 [Elizabethkingia sp. HX WHF]|uniref:Uncharacterized protein n=2 Tax=Elizabethkingia miricola TaxID=172045 RepID=A0ABY3NBJ2_ELIMR|nr:MULTISPECIES: hypothetical protein [Elizabethkingia]AVF49370.1 hypothetical protein AL491_15355 [Elizabethkingia anophelis]AVF53365.1 hypothetical protein AL492_17760 [Elizabethkingia anophelis]MDX8566276.1 hypothetical protein [Elizabethkingia sp. HX WHF]OBS13394.1 hypothetical protein ATE49_13195 [Elizabethkingia miricola]OPB87811.1 hypothetical protein BB020_04315 [Elizabethkingia occulta]